MSYILDALRRSQAERERGLTPGVHTPLNPQPGLVMPPARGVGVWALLGVALVAGLAFGAWRFSRPAQAPAQSAETTRLQEQAAAQSMPVPGQVAPQRHAARSLAMPSPPPDAVSPALQPEPLQALQPAAQVRHKSRVAHAAEPQRQVSPEPATSGKPVPGASAATPAQEHVDAGGTVFAQSDLPPAVQAQLPKLQIAGVTYSGNPKFRMVIVNGQVLHEGDLAAPDLRLERIEQGRTVWAFRGYRYALPAQ